MSRITEQKQIILEAFKPDYHPTAEELWEKIKRKHPDFSRATLYRNLAYFCENGKLSKVSVKNNVDRYELNTGSHYHLVCENCGRLENISLPTPLSTPPRLMNYDVNYHELTFYGICPKCQEKLKK
jgi:Fur family peroxide stress response transcriptional regulator